MAATPVQIVWSYDTTGSMSSCLETVKGSIRELSERLLRDIPALEIGLIAHGDYCDRDSSYLVKTMPFSSDPLSIAAWVSSVGPTGGGDAPEAYEIALRSAARDFAWRPEARKVLALIGDEEPHTASFPGNTDHVDWKIELEQLASLGVRCFSVQCLGNKHPEYFYKALAEETDGVWLPMQDLNVITDVFLAVCLQASGNVTAFDSFKAQLAEGGPVASALVPIVLRLARKKKLTGDELAGLCGIVAKLASEHGKPPTEASLPLESVDVSTVMCQGACEVQLVQTFVNRDGIAGKDVSFEYRFALPSGAAVFHFEAKLSSGRHIVGVVKGREESRREYKRAMARGQKAFLVEQNDADLFTMNLGNLDNDERVQITLRYLTDFEELDMGLGLRLRLPQHVAPRAGGKATAGTLARCPISVDVTVDASLGASSLKSASHSNYLEVLTPEGSDGAMHGRISLLPEHGPLIGDIVLDVKCSFEPPEVTALAEHCEHLDSTVIRVELRPATAPSALQGEGVFHAALVLDTSASMQGNSIVDATVAAKTLLQALEEKQEKNPLCSLTTSFIHMRQHAKVVCTASSAAETAAILLDTSAAPPTCGGGSNFAAAIETAATLPSRPDVVVFISDGQGPEVPQATFAKAISAAPMRIFCLGVGPDPGTELLTGLAVAGGGTCELAVQGPDGLAAAARRLANDMLVSPSLLQIEGIGPGELWPERVLAYPGRRTVAYMHVRGALAEDAVVRTNGIHIPLTHGITGQRLHRLAARSRILELERFNVPGEQGEAIKALAMAHGLASSQTSFVAIEEQEHQKNTSKVETTEDLSVSEADSSDCSPKRSKAMRLRSASPAEMDLATPDAMFASSFLTGAERPHTRSEISDLCSEMNDSLLESLHARVNSLKSCEASCETLSGGSSAFYSRSRNRTRGPSGYGSKKVGGAGMVLEMASGVGRALSFAGEQLRRAPHNLAANLWRAPSYRSPNVVLVDLVCPDHLGSFSASMYVGTISHPEFPPGDHPFALELTAQTAPLCFVGQWTAMGQTEEVVVTFGDSDAVTITNTTGGDKTVLLGSVNTKTGHLHGKCKQNGDSSGTFDLAPVQCRLELQDTDGDRLVFVRLLDGSIAEYCNRKLVVKHVLSLRVDQTNGICEDGEGRFTIPAEERMSTIQALEEFLVAGGCTVTRS